MYRGALVFWHVVVYIGGGYYIHCLLCFYGAFRWCYNCDGSQKAEVSVCSILVHLDGTNMSCEDVVEIAHEQGVGATWLPVAVLSAYMDVALICVEQVHEAHIADE